MAPGSAMRRRTVLSTLPIRACEYALAADVPISARCTEADAAAGARPIAMRRVDDVRP